MADPAFALNLGGGVYLDSDGNIIAGPASGTIVYESAFKLPIDPKKAADALKGVKDALADVDDASKNQKLLQTFNDIYGFLFADGQKVDVAVLLGLLSAVSKIAGTVAPILLVVGFAFDVAQLLGLFKEGPSALETLMNNRFDALKTQFSSVATLIINQNLEQGRIDVRNLNASVIEYVNNLKSSNPNPAQLEVDSINIHTTHENMVGGVSKLLSKATYQTIFDASEHSQVWALMQRNLFTYRGGPGSASPALMPVNGKPTFDHRLMIPLATFAAESYLATARGVAPEYRSTGEFRQHLKDFAKAIAGTADVPGLVDALRSEVLARTIYTAADFSVLLEANEVDPIPSQSVFAPPRFSLSPSCNRFPVGALDLRYHDNAFFSAFFTDLFKAETQGWARTTKKACMDFRWQSPAIAEFAEKTQLGDKYRIINPQECADAANAQSELDYAELLAVSGYAQLLQLATLFRNEATQPSQSQTVQIKTPVLQRKPQPVSSVIVESELPLVGKITSRAVRELEKITASVEIWTQPIKRARPIEYNVQLRTLKSIWGGPPRWREPNYSAFRFVHYERSSVDPFFMEMVTDQRDMVLAELKKPLIAGSSPRGAARHEESTEDTVTFKAHTFDWWIPVKPPFSIEAPFEKTERALRGLGHDGLSPDRGMPKVAASMRVMSDPGARFAKTTDVAYKNSYPEVSWLSGAQDWEGEHRDPRETDVTIKWAVDWDGDRMQVRLEADPADRNYVVYVVVEEQLRGEGAQVLHTAIPVPINGQLTYVPQAFFDAERKAVQDAAKAAAEFNRKYSLSTEVGPSDPVVGWLRPGDLADPGAVRKLLSLAERHEPEILRQVLRAEHRGSNRVAAPGRHEVPIT